MNKEKGSDILDKLKADIILSGAGVRGCYEAGCLSNLNEHYDFSKAIGTSAGSILCALLKVNYTMDELKKIMCSVNYKKMMNINSKIPFIGKYINLFAKKGLYSTDYIENWINSLLKAKGKTTFGDIPDGELNIVLTDITSKRTVVFPRDLHLYNINPKTFSISKAVAGSIAIPMFFQPLRLEWVDNDGNKKVSYFCDGGLLQNYFLEFYDNVETYDKPIFGIHFKQEDNIITKKTSILSYLQMLINTVVDNNKEEYLFNKNLIYSFGLISDGINVSSTNFDLNYKDCLDMYNSGDKQARQYLESKDFKNYILKYNK